LPEGQATHNDDPDEVEYVPGGHRLHDVDPGDDHEPAGQTVQTKLDPDEPD